jgi:hypothetical protein
MKTRITTDPTLRFLREHNLPLTRANYLYIAYMGNPPEELDPEVEASLPREVRKRPRK